MLEIKRLSYIYNAGTRLAVLANDSINLSIASGETVGIVGPTGSGKSTLLKQIAGILKPSSGEILMSSGAPSKREVAPPASAAARLPGRALAKMALPFLRRAQKIEHGGPRGKCGNAALPTNTPLNSQSEGCKKNGIKIGMVFQYPEHQLFAETVHSDIAFGPLNLGCSRAEADALVNEAMDFVGLPKTALNMSPFELSGGEKRRVAIAGVLAMNPEILILDEPTASLDSASRKVLIEHLRAYQQQKSTTLLVVSHNMNDIIELCDKVVVMKDGRVQYFGPTMDLFYGAENLSHYDLEPPPVIEIVKALRAKGYDVSKTVRNVEELEKEIWEQLACGQHPI